MLGLEHYAQWPPRRVPNPKTISFGAQRTQLNVVGGGSSNAFAHSSNSSRPPGVMMGDTRTSVLQRLMLLRELQEGH